MAKIYEFSSGIMVADTGMGETFVCLPDSLLEGLGFCTDLEMELLDMSLFQAESIYMNQQLSNQQAAFFKGYMHRVLNRIERSTVATYEIPEQQIQMGF